MILDTIACWLVIIGSWAAVSIWKTPAVILVAILIIASRYYALLIIGHDGVHRRLFNKRALNDRFSDIFIYGAIGLIMRKMDHNHLQHHLHLATEADPDNYKYTANNKATRFRFVVFCVGLLGLFEQLSKIYFRKNATVEGEKKSRPKSDPFNAIDVFVLLMWQVGLIGGLSYFIAWWAYPVLWLLPAYLSTVFDGLRSFCEHSEGFEETSREGSLHSHLAPAIERFFLAPMNMNHHIVHHLWPSIPYYNLPEADRRLRATYQGTDLTWRGSYLRHLIRYFGTLPKAQNI